ncbi:single-stranded-DNA-specific exonuclease RecJ [Arenicella xantha]|uniref:Single-stranded-DNA-specific exonuclease RecJ n=1 Tax=Arenicella xantha TaxID=644221 RepID=A0A395JP26_9GAMM|nr:single-stranded-DNA-specific exonuclease RecJ [Arenicella xantha]RBP51537.1 exonuclease RecJ [Arenicella xantha]
MTDIQIQARTTSQASPLTGVSRVLSQVLNNRGVTSDAALEHSLKRLLPPNGLTNIEQAGVLLAEAVMAGANVVIVGDFDADGATSCALAVRCLRAFGLQNVSYLVPNRFEFGYGLSPEIVGVAAMRQPDIIVTVDNGISSVSGVHAAQALGMSVLITDHHLPGEEIPTADVIVNPNLPGDRFASKNLAGVGVIFYVMLAVRVQLRKQGWFQSEGVAETNMSQFLDLVALGTVADVVPLDANNRILVQQGMQRIRQGQGCAGIQALLTVGKRNAARLSSSDLGFAVGPRLNAAGRLDDMSVGIECLLTDDPDKAMALALQLDELNKERRNVEQSMQQDALAVVEKIELDDTAETPPIFVLSDATWHQGVVGLVASRIKERTKRPVLALAPSDADGEWKGSARSVEGVHIRDLLARVDALHPNLILKFGGHAMAAGLSVRERDLARFKRVLHDVALEMTANHDWSQIVWTDGALQSDEFNLELADQLRTISPWGQGFPEPVFEGEFKVVDSRVVGETHAKLVLQPVGGEQQVDAIFFGYLDTHAELPSGTIRAVYRLDINEFRERLSLQLMLQHIE